MGIVQAGHLITKRLPPALPAVVGLPGDVGFLEIVRNWQPVRTWNEERLVQDDATDLRVDFLVVSMALNEASELGLIKPVQPTTGDVTETDRLMAQAGRPSRA